MKSMSVSKMSVDSLKVKRRLKKVKTILVVKSPAVIQTLTITTPKIFSLTRRCLNGRNLASVRSREIAVRLNNDAKGKKKRTALTSTKHAILI